MKEEIYTHLLNTKNRTYFFDVKKADNDTTYLIITESKKTESGFEKNKIIVFEEHIEDFLSSLNKVCQKLKSLNEPIEKKSYSVEKIRTKQPNAYMPWKKEDDIKLELLYCEGKSINELSQIFERNEGAIISRIKKLELNEKYN